MTLFFAGTRGRADDLNKAFPNFQTEPNQTGSGTLVAGGTLVISSVTIADPGRSYKICTGGAVFMSRTLGAATASSIGLEVRLDNNAWSDVDYLTKGLMPTFVDTNFSWSLVAPMRTGPSTYTGAHTLYLLAKNIIGVNQTIPAGDGYDFTAISVPI